MNESDYTAKLSAALKQCDAVVIPLVAGMRGISGMPDRFICHRIWAGFLECKGEHTKITSLQVYLHAMLNEQQPGICYVCRYIGPNVLQIEYDKYPIGRYAWDMVGLLTALQVHRASIGGGG